MRHDDIRRLLTNPRRQEAIEAIRTTRLARRIRRLMRPPTNELLERIKHLQEQR